MLALDYDPESALRYLRRLHAAVEAGDAAVAECAVAHPPALDRARRFERALWGRVHEGRILRVNREVFRRTAGRETLAAALERVELPSVKASHEPEPDALGVSSSPSPRGRLLLWTAAAAGLLVLVVGAILLFAR
jgi:hypothetical protein